MPRRMSVCPTASQTRTPEEPGSSPRQRLDHGRGQLRRAAGRYPHPRAAGKLDLDRRPAAHPAPPAICRLHRRRLGRRDQHLGEAIGDSAELLPPAIDLPGTDIDAARHLADIGPGLEALRDNRPLLLLRPPPPPFPARDHLNPRHRTVSCTAASAVTCTDASSQPVKPASPQGGPHRTVAKLSTWSRIIATAARAGNP